MAGEGPHCFQCTWERSWATYTAGGQTARSGVGCARSLERRRQTACVAGVLGGGLPAQHKWPGGEGDLGCLYCARGGGFRGGGCPCDERPLVCRPQLMQAPGLRPARLVDCLEIGQSCYNRCKEGYRNFALTSITALYWHPCKAIIHF